MWTKSEDKIGNRNVIIYQEQDGLHLLSVIPTLGANINRLKIKGQELIDGVMSADEIESNLAYKSVFLAPFPNRTKNGAYSFNGQNYQLEINESPLNNALHGFIYQQSFEIIREELNAHELKIVISYDYKGVIT